MGIIKNIDKRVLVYIALAFVFSVGVRMIWVFTFYGYESFMWNGTFMINTNDGYAFAEGARDILAGFHQENDLSPTNTAISKLTAFFATILPFSFENVILYLPAFLSSLVVIPIVLIGKSIKSLEVGFIAALLGSIAWSYYNRTMVGYFDTDMLNIVLPTFVLWSLVLAFNTNEQKYILLTAFFIVISSWWYTQSLALNLSFFGLVFLYMIIFDRHNLYMYKLLSIMLIAISGLGIFIKLLIILALFVLFLKNKFSLKIYLFILLASALLFLAMGGLEMVWGLLKVYVFRETTDQSQDSIALQFFSVMQTVREAGKIPFDVFANRISGNVIAFFLSIVGYLYLCYKHKVMLLALPMIGLGFLAYSGGLRFTVYAVPAMALGIAYLIIKLSEFVENRSLRYAFAGLMTFLVLLPNVLHVNDYKVPTVFNTQEVQVLDNLKKRASREDYVVSWWDYGYPLRYYADVKTLVDGAKHSGEVNFAPSFILTHTQQEAANMARLEVEYTEKSFREKNNTQSNMAKMLKDYGFNDTNDFLLSLKDDIKLPKKTRDIFIYLPYRMMGIFPTVARFSYIDLMSGKDKKQPFFFQTSSFNDTGKTLEFAQGISFDKSTSFLMLNGSKVPVKDFYMVDYDKSAKVVVQTQRLHQNGVVSIVFARAYNSFFIFDKSALNSTYIQLFLFEKYDKNLFEPVELTPYVKVYKLKK